MRTQMTIAMRHFLRFAILSVCGLLLASCTPALNPLPATPPAVVTADYPADLQGARLYRIAPEQSTLHILVYRGGTMANLGHNHVVSSSTLAGHVWMHDSLTRSGFSITLPVHDLNVDNPQARTAEGADFVSVVSDAARAGTRTNMLKPEQLDGEHYPVIRLRSLSITGTRALPKVLVQITIKDQKNELTVPVQLSINERSMRITGQLQIKQTDFGITPYSVAMGALQVQDQLTIKFELVALPTQTSNDST
jgi:polyisoprenoid-binding protein YceI